MAGIRDHSDSNTNAVDSGSVNNLSLWAPILLGLIGGLSPPSQSHIESRDRIDGTNLQDSPEDDELGRESESSVPQRTRGSTSAIRMLQDMRTMAASESENSEDGRDRSGRMILFVQSMKKPWLFKALSIICPRMIRIATEPRRHKRKQSKQCQPLPEENLQCPVCLEDFETGTQEKELPLDDSKIEPNGDRNSGQSSGRVGTGRRYWTPIPWPYDGLGTLSASQSESTLATSSDIIPGHENAALRDDN
ncbi:hypothetical protein F3Y22_tig00111105pilonHSYRG00333 [Hibiscus syriacus]|uniref:Uncharacterized protein n=1 Tax=Hibiscus syriacus TaxID=106335 RepID=A0A6A2Z0X9_HIBSY|nr:hypothetical protein F3Y22_tig00111105pilonHSYRG00333 [Hibiscus syriacus]